MRNQSLAIALSITALIACNGKKKANADLQEAFKLHEEAILIRQETEGQLETLITNSDSLFIITYGGRLDSITWSLQAWDEQLVEVPGFEEEHDHSGHDHHHGELPELHPKQHLEVQQHLIGEIKIIAEDVRQIVENRNRYKQ
ncbi:MAG: hypothetical protein KI790_17550 [Cyclobacteriaceae bacterium]|nr:hypothetical protein [Cyclobacteriaceae bacterium HetDA_MAG_MS6]